MTITRHLLATVNNHTLRVTLSWDSGFPFAVRMDMHPRGETVSWEFAWDLLTIGVRRPAGVGDILIAPADEDLTRITLWPGRVGVVDLLLPTRELAAFLADTWMAVPPALPDFIPAEFFEAKP